MVDEFDPDAHAEAYDPESRARALQSLLLEKELLSTDAVDEIIATYENEIGPLNGARLVARAWTDDSFRDRLLADGTAAIEAFGLDVDTETVEIEVVANDPTTHNLVVCTLCSCYPWPLLGLPPTWYKTPAYRSRAVRDPRGLLAEEFSLDLAAGVEVEVWDSTSEVRYMVLPRRPPGTADATEADLVERVTRDAMIGVDRLGDGRAAADGGPAPSTDRLAALDAGIGDRPTFEAPWQARAFALAVALAGDAYEWDAFSDRLAAAIDRGAAPTAPGTDPEGAYYEQWLAALETLLLDRRLVDGPAVVERTAAFAAGDRTAHEFLEGDPHGHVDGHSGGHEHGHGRGHGHH